MAKYSWAALRQINFSDADIELARQELSESDRVKSVVTVQRRTLSPAALTALAKLASELDGTINSDYHFSVIVPKDADEIREAALYELRYAGKYDELRTQRAEESNVWPDGSDD